jgi:hypothetical protein
MSKEQLVTNVQDLKKLIESGPEMIWKQRYRKKIQNYCDLLKITEKNADMNKSNDFWRNLELIK